MAYASPFAICAHPGCARPAPPARRFCCRPCQQSSAVGWYQSLPFEGHTTTCRRRYLTEQHARQRQAAAREEEPG